jgi:hypothetical protein
MIPAPPAVEDCVDPAELGRRLEDTLKRLSASSPIAETQDQDVLEKGKNLREGLRSALNHNIARVGRSRPHQGDPTTPRLDLRPHPFGAG